MKQRLQIIIQLNNEAFRDYEDDTLIRLEPIADQLRTLADNLDSEGHTKESKLDRLFFNLRDINGNPCGYLKGENY